MKEYPIIGKSKAYKAKLNMKDSKRFAKEANKMEREMEKCEKEGIPCSYGICDECPLTHKLYRL